MKIAKKANERNEREDALRSAFVKVLLRSPLKDVNFLNKNRRISIAFFGEKFSYRIIIKREKDIGDWSRKRKEIYIDRQIAMRNGHPHTPSLKALAVHEAIEKFLVEKYGLKVDEEAHVVATRKEKQYLKKIGGDWKNHQMLIHRKWLKLKPSKKK